MQVWTNRPNSRTDKRSGVSECRPIRTNALKNRRRAAIKSDPPQSYRGGNDRGDCRMVDIAVYGYLAAEIGQVFFKTSDPAVALLQSFAVFGLAYVVRPLGGIFFGAMGDRVGRHKTLA